MKLYSDEYLALIRDHHKGHWGGACKGYEDMIHKYMLLTKSKTLLDFGAGKGMLSQQQEIFMSNYEDYYKIIPYDPGNPAFDEWINPPVCDASFSADVMEHIEPEYIDNTLQFIYDKTNNWTYHKICTKPASNNFRSTMKDEKPRNLHTLVKPAHWWANKFERYFTLHDFRANLGHVEFLGIKRDKILDL